MSHSHDSGQKENPIMNMEAVLAGRQILRSSTEGTIGMAWIYITASDSILSVFEYLRPLESDASLS